MIGLKPRPTSMAMGGQYVNSRLEIQQRFIKYAIAKGYVTDADTEYRISQNSYLTSKIGKMSFGLRDLFVNLQGFLSQVDDISDEKDDEFEQKKRLTVNQVRHVHIKGWTCTFGNCGLNIQRQKKND